MRCMCLGKIQFVCVFCRRHLRMWRSVGTFCPRWSSWHPVENSPLRPQPASRSWSNSCWYSFSPSLFLIISFISFSHHLWTLWLQCLLFQTNTVVILLSCTRFVKKANALAPTWAPMGVLLILSRYSVVLFFLNLQTCFCSYSSSVSFVQQEAKIEPEDFTSRLYKELNSSPQPYLVPFLKVRPATHSHFHQFTCTWRLCPARQTKAAFTQHMHFNTLPGGAVCLCLWNWTLNRLLFQLPSTKSVPSKN